MNESNHRLLVIAPSDTIRVRHTTIQASTPSLTTEQVTIPIRHDPNETIVVDRLRDSFTIHPEAALTQEHHLFAAFLTHVARHVGNSDRSACVSVLRQCISHFHQLYLQDSHIHAFAASLDPEVATDVLKSYVLAYSILQEEKAIPDSLTATPLLLSGLPTISSFAVFGGQGVNEICFDELQTLYDIYTPYVKDVVTRITTDVLEPLRAKHSGTHFYTHGLDVLSWLSGDSPRPSIEYLASIPVSMPLIGITQLIQYLVTCRYVGVTPGFLRNQLRGATGHSQGLISAVAIAASDSYTSLYENIAKAVKWLFLCGLYGQKTAPIRSIDPTLVDDCVAEGEDYPSPMLSVNGLSLEELNRHIDSTNSFLDDGEKLQVSLHNARRAFVVTGIPKSLCGLVKNLRKFRAPNGIDQSKLPFSKRSPVFTARFIPVKVPYHSEYLKGATAQMMKELEGEELWTAVDLTIPVLSTGDGQDVRGVDGSLTQFLCDQVFTTPVDWPAATNFPSGTTHVIDFGAGGLAGIGTLVNKVLEGRGIRTIIVGHQGTGDVELYDPKSVQYETDWKTKWGPQLLRTADGEIHLSTALSRLLRKPPIMVAGMTPCTVKAGFVSAIMSAGYHVELAGGGHYTPAALREKVEEIRALTPSGQGITLNALYINQRQFGFQLPLWQQMRQENLPIEGFCVAAGIPSIDKAGEIISGLRSAGIQHIAFKPGSVDGIRQVVAIAAAHSDFPVILQWTGGRAGGHHSYEDFHQPILATYGYIRTQDNLVLVAGSGFGGAEDMWPYLTGDWSIAFGCQPMPFDGFLLGSRVMVAKEAHASSSVKDLIVSAPGVSDHQWEATYDKPTGGILTVQSELGEPIHKVATRCVKLWKEFDNTVFKLPKDKRFAWLKERRIEVINKLNAHHFKPWFGARKTGEVVFELGDMTYEETAFRMVRLMFVAKESRWIDVSLRNLMGDWLRRIEERFALDSGEGDRPSILPSFSSLDEPVKFLETFFKQYSGATEQLLSSEDQAYFLATAQRPGQKPVPFIPVLDANFEVWFKKDSLWAAEDIEAVFDQDPQRVCILQGPVSVSHSIVKDEPIKEMLGGIVSDLTGRLLQRSYNANADSVPKAAFLAIAPRPPPGTLKGIKTEVADQLITHTVDEAPQDVKTWYNLLAGNRVDWLYAAVTLPHVVRGGLFVESPFVKFLFPRLGQKFIVRYDEEDTPVEISVFGGSRTTPNQTFLALSIKFDTKNGQIEVLINESRSMSTVSLSLQYEITNSGAIFEVEEGRVERIKSFYWQLWYGDDSICPQLGLHNKFLSREVTVDGTSVEQFCSIIGNQNDVYKLSPSKGQQYAPLDYAIVCGWKAIMQSVFATDLHADLLNLVHLSNAFRLLPEADSLVVGRAYSARAELTAVKNIDSGKVVTAKGYIIHDGRDAIEVTSSFLFRGKFNDYENTFESLKEPDYLVTLGDEAAVGVLQSKEWFEWTHPDIPLMAGIGLTFRIASRATFADRTSYQRIAVSGKILIRDELQHLVEVGEVDFDDDDCRGNPVLAYLQRHGHAQDQVQPLSTAGYTIASKQLPNSFTAPLSNEQYSISSGDFNPIHVNPIFSDYASLPGTITHGLWTSAATRRYVEEVVALGHLERIRSFSCNFVGMVLPGDILTCQARHVGMKNGNMIVNIVTRNQENQAVLEAVAEVTQARTVYTFTGQGSQEQNMGMELYAKSDAAKKIWDSADDHLLSVYGLSILEIVRENPKERTVHFGGIKGQAIRQRYMDMSYDVADKDGKVRTMPLFPDIDVRVQRYTFKHPTGLLFATQFAQIALTVAAKAAFEDLKSKGLVPEACAAFAGHSLGEYSALASIADVLPVSSLVDVVFYRGITMQRAVERDHENRSNYAMTAVNPSRVSASFNEDALQETVRTIARCTGSLLEIVNYNIIGQQYVCAGELVALAVLTNVLNYMKMKKVDLKALLKSNTVEQVQGMLETIVQESHSSALELKSEHGRIVLERGLATIPLQGIDVPFHSKYLWAGVLPFRAYLSKKILAQHIDPDLLIHRYIPNLTAKPFDLSKEYVQLIVTQTNSPPLSKILAEWHEEGWQTDARRRELAHTILLELLAYQFASPVRWIETQDLLFGHYQAERMIEIGPSPTLTSMAARTQKLKYEQRDNSRAQSCSILCIAKDLDAIAYTSEDDDLILTVPSDISSPQISSTVESTVNTVTSSSPVLVVSQQQTIEDTPLSAPEVLIAIVAQKLKKKPIEIPLTKSIKDLVSGKSTLQNEIIGDLQSEFSTAPEKAEEMPLDELGLALNSGFSGSAGKYTSGLISRLVSNKLPGGFGIAQVKSHLMHSWGLGPLRSDGVLLFATSMEPSARLASEQEAKLWLDSAASNYAASRGITLSRPNDVSGPGSSSGPAISNEEFVQFKSRQDAFASQQVEVNMRYLGHDSRAGEIGWEQEKSTSSALRQQLDDLSKEHGEVYVDGIRPMFSALKARKYDSSWAWAKQDALLMYYDIIFGRLKTVDREITARCIAILNRANPELLLFMEYHIQNTDTSRGPTYLLAKDFGTRLIENAREAIGDDPLYKDVTFPTAPKTTISASGDIKYTEVVRDRIRKLELYVQEMASGPEKLRNGPNIEKVADDVQKLWNLIKNLPGIPHQNKDRIKALYDGVVQSLHDGVDRISPSRPSSASFLRPQMSGHASPKVDANKVPLLHLKRRLGSIWEYSSNLTSVYLDILLEIATSGTTFVGKNALLTGVGKGSINIEILKGLLSGGAHVVVTTSNYNRATVAFYQNIFQEIGSKGAALIVVPFNGASKQDVQALVDYIYNTLKMDLDYVIPFAAISENGREIDALDDKSELAHRIMLTNVLRLLGYIKTHKASRNFVTRPTQIILPLSPNHGLFGNDGLYSESKIALETLFNRWSSESWGEYLCLAGAVIGWTRGTGLMDASNIVAEELESYGVRTFSAKEMAFNILGLCHPLLFSVTQVEPIWADLTGNMAIPDLAEITARIRNQIEKRSLLCRAVTRDNSADFVTTKGADKEKITHTINVLPRANFRCDFPSLPNPSSLTNETQLRGLIDLDKVVVVTGFAEVGPYGSSRTRWEMEARGELTIEGCIEMAWLQGLIKHHNGSLKDGSLYVGWVDSKTGEPVEDKNVRSRYEASVLKHSGIRLIEPEIFRGYDPEKKIFQQEIQLTHDLEPIEMSQSDADKFKLEHGDKCDVWSSGDVWLVKLKKGAQIFVPKSFRFNRAVAGQIPSGWDAGRYGIPPDISERIDRVTLWSLVCTAEALNLSGITDPYELYEHVHPSEVGTCLGSGLGGTQSMSQMFVDRKEEKDVQSDILQETFINTTAGWINLLLMSSSGPIKVPVGACATALQSFEIACDTLRSGKAKVMIAGGFDDTTEEGSYEFANMKATSNSDTEFAMGREPTEMSRPATSTRAGFMESQGSGVHILMTAATAIKIGAPIRGVVAFTSTSTDKAGRSIPAPGRGALTVAREIKSEHPTSGLQISYRHRQLKFRRKQIAEWLDYQRNELAQELEFMKATGETPDANIIRLRTNELETEALRQEKDALSVYGMLEGSDARTSPLRRALAVWGLNADDIGVLSIHGTSTAANEKNETQIWNDIFTALGRTPGNAVPIVAQKSLVGHSKGGSAAWQMMGLLQSLNSGIIPGNRNGDNIDPLFEQHTHLMFPSRSIHTDGLKAGAMSSFGFGQVGGIAVVIHPHYLLSALSPMEYSLYQEKNAVRGQAAYKAMSDMMINNSLVKIKETPPYTPELEKTVLMNPLARARLDPKTAAYSFPAKLTEALAFNDGNAKTMAQIIAHSDAMGVGVDQELISAVPSDNPAFVSRNFSPSEIEYCRGQAHPPSSFAARWVGKEAVFKSLGVKSAGGGASMLDIEILPNKDNVPTVVLHGRARALAGEKGIKKVVVSLSHSDHVAIAFAQSST